MAKRHDASTPTEEPLTRKELILITSALICIMATSLFAHEAGNWKLGSLVYDTLSADIVRGYTCLAHSFGVVFGCALVKLPGIGFAACMQTRTRQRMFFLATSTALVAGSCLFYFAQAATPTSPFAIFFAQFIIAATTIMLVIALSQFAILVTPRTTALVIAGALVVSITLVQGFFSMFVTPPSLLAMLVPYALLMTSSLCCMAAILKQQTLRSALTQTGTSIRLASPKPSHTTTPVVLLVAALASFAIALGFMHVIPLSITTATLTHSLAFIFGVLLGIALFLFLALNAHVVTSTTIWDWISRFAFPLTVTAALLVPLTPAKRS